MCISLKIFNMLHLPLNLDIAKRLAKRQYLSAEDKYCLLKDATVSHLLIFVFSTGQVSYLKVLGMYVSLHSICAIEVTQTTHLIVLSVTETT